jgi:hypothetical protein
MSPEFSSQAPQTKVNPIEIFATAAQLAAQPEPVPINPFPGNKEEASPVVGAPLSNVPNESVEEEDEEGGTIFSQFKNRAARVATGVGLVGALSTGSVQAGENPEKSTGDTKPFTIEMPAQKNVQELPPNTISLDPEMFANPPVLEDSLPSVEKKPVNPEYGFDKLDAEIEKEKLLVEQIKTYEDTLANLELRHELMKGLDQDLRMDVSTLESMYGESLGFVTSKLKQKLSKNETYKDDLKENNLSRSQEKSLIEINKLSRDQVQQIESQIKRIESFQVSLFQEIEKYAEEAYRRYHEKETGKVSPVIKEKLKAFTTNLENPITKASIEKLLQLQIEGVLEAHFTRNLETIANLRVKTLEVNAEREILEAKIKEMKNDLQVLHATLASAK